MDGKKRGGVKPGPTGKGTTTTCLVCGKTFRRKHKDQVFCNRSCSAIGRKAWINGKKDGQTQTHPCQTCGNDIQDWYAGKKYCCQACCRDAVKKREREKTRERLSGGRKCAICGEHFIPSSEKEWICSEQCRENACEGEVYIRILRPGSNLRKDMQPTVGKIYKARRGLTHNQQRIFWIVPGFGKFGVVIRTGEAREVQPEDITELP